MTPVRLEPAALRSRVKRSTTEPLRSLIANVYSLGNFLCFCCHLLGKLLECQTGSIPIMTDVLPVLIRVQNLVCKGYQRTPEVAASMEHRHKQLSSVTKGLTFDMNPHLGPWFVCARSTGSGETASFHIRCSHTRT